MRGHLRVNRLPSKTDAVPSAEHVVRRYFAEIVDGRSEVAIDELFAPDCRILRADRSRPIEGRQALRRFVRMSIQAVPEIRTEIISMIGDDSGNVACVLEHEARFGALLLTPVGLAFAKGRKAVWQAMAFFRVVEGRIVEERVIRDEIAILRQIGLVSRLRRAALWRVARKLIRLAGRGDSARRN